MRRIKIYAAVSLFLVAATVICFAQEKEAKEKDKGTAPTITTPTITTKVISGRIGVIRPTYITVIYKEEMKEGNVVADYEKVFPIDEALIVLNVKRVEALQEGDRIEITYEEKGYVDKNGVPRIEVTTKEIRYIGPAIKGMRSR